MANNKKTTEPANDLTNGNSSENEAPNESQIAAQNDTPNDIGGNTPGNTLGDLLCFSVYSTSHAFNHLYRRLLSALGLTYPQYLVMTLLWRRDGLRVNAIGQELGLESNTLTPLLKRLEALGLVTRQRDTEDERVVLVKLSQQGKVLSEKARDIPNCVADAVGLGQDDFTKLTQLLHRVRNRLSKDPS